MTLLTDFEKETAYSEAFHTLYAHIRLNWDCSEKKQYLLLLTTPATYTGQPAATVGHVQARSLYADNGQSHTLV